MTPQERWQRYQRERAARIYQLERLIDKIIDEVGLPWTDYPLYAECIRKQAERRLAQEHTR